MPVRAIFIFEEGETVREPWNDSGPMIQYPDPPRQVPMQRLRAQASTSEDMTYEVYAEPAIPEHEAMRRVREWNQRFPAQAVPPVGVVFR
jgi:hypothetical protein